MSITPTDKPPDGEDDDDSLSRRTASLRDRVVGLFRGLFARFRPGDSDVLAAEESGSADRSPVTQSIDDELDRARHRLDSCPEFDGFPARERPLTYPGRDLANVNTPDVVSVETDEGLRLSIPENPDATLVSDVWTTVDP